MSSDRNEKKCHKHDIYKFLLGLMQSREFKVSFPRPFSKSVIEIAISVSLNSSIANRILFQIQISQKNENFSLASFCINSLVLGTKDFIKHFLVCGI